MLLETGSLPLRDDFVHDSETIAAAYHQCRDDEKEMMQDLERTPGDSSLAIDLMNIRLIGHLLDLLCHYQKDQAAAHIAKTIMSRDGTRQKRIEAGAFYNKYLIKTFYSNRGRTPAPSSHPSRPSFDFRAPVIKDELEANINEYTYPQNHQMAKKAALVRDNYRCVATKKIHIYCNVARPPNSLTTLTQCTHIFPESTNTDLHDPKKSEYVASVWALFEAFGHDSVMDALKGKNIHSLDNTLTLDCSVHSAFDRLQLWFEATEVPNHYNVVTSNDLNLGLGLPDSVTFETTDERLALPNPAFLHLHALCCKVARMSGAAEYYDQLDNDYEYDRTGPVPADILTARLHDISSSTLSHLIESVS
ncbi:hypothetical protein OE88DRAFT_1669531 [Heliocybe sulcata]|uniref:HNH nuclease domain-containing protein n=1 Tax=Heliocybe sulcata TaxID=5364 RepID=A0A5C3MKK1_9AGAM|nr:hypothetical protein OE88DRAFT_1669531 [Heliocybe sulcata]